MVGSLTVDNRAMERQRKSGTKCGIAFKSSNKEWLVWLQYWRLFPSQSPKRFAAVQKVAEGTVSRDQNAKSALRGRFSSQGARTSRQSGSILVSLCNNIIVLPLICEVRCSEETFYHV